MGAALLRQPQKVKEVCSAIFKQRPDSDSPGSLRGSVIVAICFCVAIDTDSTG